MILPAGPSGFLVVVDENSRLAQAVGVRDIEELEDEG